MVIYTKQYLNFRYIKIKKNKMNYTEFADFNELINSYKELFSDARTSKNLGEGKKRSVKNASSLVNRKTNQSNQLKNRVESIENSLESTSRDFYSQLDQQRGMKITQLLDLKKRRLNLDYQSSKLQQQSNFDPSTVTPATEAQYSRMSILRTSINQAINQLEATLDETYQGWEYDIVKNFNKPVLGEDSEQKIWEFYAYHIETLWMDHWFGLKYTIQDFEDRAMESHSEIKSKKDYLVNYMRSLEDYRSNLASAIESNASESTIQSIESQIEAAEGSLRQAAKDMAFIQSKIDALHTEMETTLRLWCDKAEYYHSSARDYFNENRKILVSRGVRNPVSEFQVKVAEMVSPIVDVIKNSATISISNPVSQRFSVFIAELYSKFEDKSLEVRDQMRQMDNAQRTEYYLKHPEQLTTNVSYPDGQTKKVLRSDVPSDTIVETLSFFNDLSQSIQNVTEFKSDVDTRVMLFNEGWNKFESGSYMNEIDSLKEKYMDFTFYREFIQKDHYKFNYGHYGITQQEKNSWESAWVQKTQANLEIWNRQKLATAAMRKRNVYAAIFNQAFDEHYSLKSSMDNAESAYIGTNSTWDSLTSDLESAYNLLQSLTQAEADYVAALADYESKLATRYEYEQILLESYGIPRDSAYSFLQTTLSGEASYQAAYPFTPLEANGTIDSSISLGDSSVFSPSAIHSIVIHNGKAIIGGDFYYWVNGNKSNKCFAKLNADGSRDTTFNFGSHMEGIVYSMAVQSDNKVLIAGYFDCVLMGNPGYNIARLNADGSRDTTFSTPTSSFPEIRSIAIQSDGKIVVVGKFPEYNGVPASKIIRLNSDGSIDTTFVTGTGFNYHAYAVAIQADDKILVGGSFGAYNGTPANQIIRLNSDGSVDTSFVTGTGFNGEIFSIAIQSDGKILLGGDVSQYNGQPCDELIRLNSDGSRDTTFVTTGTGFNHIVRSIALQSNGKIVVGGSFTSVNGDTNKKHFTRLNADGSIDSSFQLNNGESGDGFNNEVRAVAIDPSGTIYAVGYFSVFNYSDFKGLIRTLGTSYSQSQIDELTQAHYIYLGAQSDYDTKVSDYNYYNDTTVQPLRDQVDAAYVVMFDLSDEDAAYQSALTDWTNKDAAYLSFRDNVRTPAYDAYQSASQLFNQFLNKEFRFYSARISGWGIADLMDAADVIAPEMINVAYENFNIKQQEFDELQSSLEYVPATDMDKLDWLATERGFFASYLQNVCNSINAEVDTLLYASGDPYRMGYVDFLKNEVGAVPGEDFNTNYESIMEDKMQEVKGFLSSVNILSDKMLTKKLAAQRFGPAINTNSDIWNDLELYSLGYLLRPANEGYLNEQHLNGLAPEMFDFLRNSLRGSGGFGTASGIFNWLDNGGPISEGMI